MDCVGCPFSQTPPYWDRGHILVFCDIAPSPDVYNSILYSAQTEESKEVARRADPEATSPECEGGDVCEVNIQQNYY